MSSNRPERTVREVVGQLRALGLRGGDVLLVHCSFRAARPIEGGPAGLIEALDRAVGPDGTLVMPSWSDDNDRPFDPASSEASRDLGVVASLFWRQPIVRRSDHAFAFAAKGRKAVHILSDPLPLPPHLPASPVGRVSNCDGRILLLGVDHDANTSLHLAELLAGVPYRRRHYITVHGAGGSERIDYFENDHCCRLFRRVNDWLRPGGLQTVGLVGYAPSKLMRSRDLIVTVVPKLKENPFALIHPRGSDCRECADAWNGVAA